MPLIYNVRLPQEEKGKFFETEPEALEYFGRYPKAELYQISLPHNVKRSHAVKMLNATSVDDLDNFLLQSKSS